MPFNSYPVFDHPDSVTHWTCPAAPEGQTHHLIRGRCRDCMQTELWLQIQQVKIWSAWTAATFPIRYGRDDFPVPSLREWAKAQCELTMKES